MKLNDEILAALRRAIKHYGNTSQFADRIGVAHSTVLFWLSGKTTNISGKIWTNGLRRELRAFMKETPEPFIIREDPAIFSDYKGTGINREVNVTTYSAMIDFDSTVESPASFVKEHAISTNSFTNGKLESFFALELDIPAAGPFLPKGARLLLSGADYAQDGDVVVGKLRNDVALFICRYQREGNKIRLTPLDPGKPVMEWPFAENAEKIFWMYPVEEIVIDLLKTAGAKKVWSYAEKKLKTADGKKV